MEHLQRSRTRQKNIQGSIDLADQWASNIGEFGILSEGRIEYGKTPKGNPITDAAYIMFNDRIIDGISKKGVADRILPLLTKSKKDGLTDHLSETISKYLKKSERYEFGEVRDIINGILMSEETAL